MNIWTVCSAVCSCAHQRKYQSPVSLAFVRGIHRSPVDSPHKGQVTRKMFPFDDVIMSYCNPVSLSILSTQSPFSRLLSFSFSRLLKHRHMMGTSSTMLNYVSMAIIDAVLPWHIIWCWSKFLSSDWVIDWMGVIKLSISSSDHN